MICDVASATVPLLKSIEMLAYFFCISMPSKQKWRTVVSAQNVQNLDTYIVHTFFIPFKDLLS